MEEHTHKHLGGSEGRTSESHHPAPNALVEQGHMATPNCHRGWEIEPSCASKQEAPNTGEQSEFWQQFFKTI